ncbi:hypothetical protein KUTG_04021 [Kutzneria sp. 744]|nr:hypothetical protein KUTG_04021 [Kutzneria sp. 744]
MSQFDMNPGLLDEIAFVLRTRCSYKIADTRGRLNRPHASSTVDTVWFGLGSSHEERSQRGDRRAAERR